MVSYTTSHIYKFWYKIDTVLSPFLKTGTSDRTYRGLDELRNSLGFSLSFSLTALLSDGAKPKKNILLHAIYTFKKYF